MAVIKDVDGGTLRLTSNRLEELTGELFEGVKYTLKLSALAKAKRAIKIQSPGNPPISVRFSAKDRQIGCRIFDEKTFARILKAAGIKPKKVVRKRTKARK